MRSTASFSKDSAYDAEKILRCRRADFFNRICSRADVDLFEHLARRLGYKLVVSRTPLGAALFDNDTDPLGNRDRKVLGVPCVKV
jgi:hypothetical protein